MSWQTCGHCKHYWKYSGSSKHYATCPRCYYKVKIKIVDVATGIKNFTGL